MSSYNYFFIYVLVNMKGRGRVCMWILQVSQAQLTRWVGLVRLGYYIPVVCLEYCEFFQQDKSLAYIHAQMARCVALSPGPARKIRRGLGTRCVSSWTLVEYKIPSNNGDSWF